MRQVRASPRNPAAEALLALRHRLRPAQAANCHGPLGVGDCTLAIFLPPLRQAPLPLGQAQRRLTTPPERARAAAIISNGIAGSFNGRTADSGSAYRGSSPCPATNFLLFPWTGTRPA